jgi:hypothetical protein
MHLVSDNVIPTAIAWSSFPYQQGTADSVDGSSRIGKELQHTPGICPGALFFGVACKILEAHRADQSKITIRLNPAPVATDPCEEIRNNAVVRRAYLGEDDA